MSQEFKFLVVNTKEEWKEGAYELDISDDGIAFNRESGYFIEKIVDKSLDIIDTDKYKIKDIAINECGIFYILVTDSSQSEESQSCTSQIFIYDQINGRNEYLNLPETLNELEGIALSHDTLYITGNNHVFALARTNWQLKWMIESTDTEGHSIPDNFNPSKIAVDNDENIYVLENYALENDSTKFKRILKFDKGGRCQSYENESCKAFFEKEIEESISDITVNADGTIYVLHQDKIERLSGNDLMPDDNLNKLYIDIDGFKMGLDGIFYFIKENEIGSLKFASDKYSIQNNAYFIKRFDSKELNLEWHKLVLDAVIPDKTQINVYYYASDEETPDQEMLDQIPWNKSITFRKSDVNLYDSLILDSLGRYLYIKLEPISTDEYITPKIRSLKVYFPRNSYLRYLPAVYQEDEASKDFLERFLSLFETLLWDKEEQIDQIARYFDAEATPSEFLRWLCTWTATIFDETWSEEQKRNFLKNAVKLYKKRGTRDGLEELIEIYTGNKPIIIENWQLYETDANGNLKLKCVDNRKIRHYFNWNELPQNKDSLLNFLKDEFNVTLIDDISLMDITPKDSDTNQSVSGFSVKDKDDREIIMAFNKEKKKAILKINNCEIYELKVKEEDGKLNIYAKDVLEKLFGDSTPYSFCVLFTPYLFSIDNVKLEEFNCIEYSDNRTIPKYPDRCVIPQKFRDELQKKDLQISDSATISNLRENEWMISDKEDFLVIKIYDDLDIYNVYKNPQMDFESQMTTTRRILENEKPANTVAGAVVLQPWFYLDMHTYLGVNTFLSKSVMQLGKSSIVSRDTILTDTEDTGQIETHARIGVDTKLT